MEQKDKKQNEIFVKGEKKIKYTFFEMAVGERERGKKLQEYDEKTGRKKGSLSPISKYIMGHVILRLSIALEKKAHTLCSKLCIQLNQL